MAELRTTRMSDLTVVASWVDTPELCWWWAGASVRFPIDLERLPDEIRFSQVASWSLVEQETLVGFGQFVPKPDNRLHFSRVIVAPESRGKGLGRQLAEQLLQRALAQSPAIVSLNVNTKNVVAIELYQSLGFRPAKRPVSEKDAGHVYMVYSP